MFKLTQQELSPSSAYFAQVFLVPLSVGVFSFPLMAIYALFVQLLTNGAEPGVWGCLDLLVLVAVGMAFGAFVGSRWPTVARVGMWIWIPSGLLVLWEIQRGFGDRNLMREYVLPSLLESGGTHEGLTRLFVADPAISSAAYSIGLLLAWRKLRRKRAESAPE